MRWSVRLSPEFWRCYTGIDNDVNKAPRVRLENLNNFASSPSKSKSNQRLYKLFIIAYRIAVVLRGQVLGEFKIGGEFGVDAV